MDKAPFDVRELVRTMAKSFQISARRKNLELSSQIDDTVPAFLLGDPCRLRQILVNLVGNAIKFTESGGVSLEVVCSKKTTDGLWLRFEVSDTGIGVSALQTR